MKKKKQTKKISYGYIPDKQESHHYYFGSGQIGGQILQIDGQWDLYLPSDEFQNLGWETYDCTAFGTTNALETLIKRKFGIDTNRSDRALGNMAGTGEAGNSPHTVAETLRKQGTVDETTWPFGGNNIEEYYSPKPLPDNVLKEAKEWLAQYSFNHDWVFQQGTDLETKKVLIKKALQYSPLGVSVFAWYQNNGLYIRPGGALDNHWVCAYGYVDEGLKIFDSYDQSHKLVDWDNIGSAKRYSIEKKSSVSKSWWDIIKIFFKNL